MDSKNVIAAISLSSAVIVLYSLFFVPEKPITNTNPTEKNKIEQNTDTPSLDQKETLIQTGVKSMALPAVNQFALHMVIL